MSFHGFSACLVLQDRPGGKKIDTKEKLSEKYMIGESIWGRDLWADKEIFNGFAAGGHRINWKKEVCEAGGVGPLKGADAYNRPDRSDEDPLSVKDTGDFVREETVGKEEVLLCSDYGYDLLRYRMFYLQPYSLAAMEGAPMVAEDTWKPVRCRGMPAMETAFRGEGGYGVEISQFRRTGRGYWRLEDYQRLEGLTEDPDLGRQFYRRMIEGRVFPCALMEHFEDWSENF